MNDADSKTLEEMNQVIRKCDKCGFRASDREFTYHGDGVFHCPRCPSFYTHIAEVITDKEKGE